MARHVGSRREPNKQIGHRSNSPYQTLIWFSGFCNLHIDADARRRHLPSNYSAGAAFLIPLIGLAAAWWAFAPDRKRSR